ncbi:hypothetical protein BV25DRAFT_1819850 [Artomyces pyxidatus]|uniref:Uncharacterized protein n=1 Tax=Artomyces pyxidatus TaxID=48021 RepID=A0ACB8TGL6_9AGAM|nr:hypothetical protein BV25DRAFT_1819850 [Artomyces pyxidatus]
MLPRSLWALVSSLAFSLPELIAAQSMSRMLLLNTPLHLTGPNFTSNPLIFSLPMPPSTSSLNVSVALCNNVSASNLQFFVTNNSDVAIPGPDGGTDVWELVVEDVGVGSLNVGMGDGAATLAVWGGSASDSVELGVSADDPLHELLTTLPLFGDSTSNVALLYSPPFLPPNPLQPIYPNYTLPPANLSLPTPPASTAPNFTLILAPASSRLSGQPQTACALRNLVSTATEGQVLKQQDWLRDEDGWRTEWLISGLTPLTNYSMYTIQDGTKVNGPVFFTTKSASFACQLVHSLPFCPTASYAIPLPPPPARSAAYDAATLPTAVTTPLLSYLTNFTTSLLTSACGRDWYSPLRTCADCQRAYRHWLCSVSLPRCGEFPQSDTSTSASLSLGGDGNSQQVLSVPAALAPQPSGTNTRNPNFPPFGAPYTVLLPCLETCNAVDRACPNFLGFRCPLPSFNANQSYGVGYVDGGAGKEGVMGGGSTGATQDRWGSVWCNAS